MHGPTRIRWADLTPPSRQTENNEVSFEISDLATGDAAGGGSGSGSGGEQAAGGSGAAPSTENPGLGAMSASGDSQYPQAGWLSVKLASEWTWTRLWVRIG